MATEVDLLILGGGCAGLSFARELAAQGTKAPTTCIIEQRARYDDDRTWCFWDDDAALATDLVEHRWSHVQLRSAGQLVDVACGDRPYQMIGSARFYADALQKISGAPQLNIELGVSTLAEPYFAQGMWHIDTDAGQRRARKLIDTRPGPMPTAPQAAPILWQSFFGQEIVCEAPLFDPSTVMLMDFFDDVSAALQGRIIFTYVLPLSAYRALIEVTVFDPTSFCAADLSQALQRQICARIGSKAFTVARTEHGILPMGLPDRPLSSPASASDYVQVGLMHGGARASTGYAFQRIQRWAQTCAAQLIANAPMQPHAADSLLIRSMDRLFLSLLRHRPDTASTFFLSMFRHADRDVLIRFLSDRTSLRDALGIVASLPALPFLRQLGHDLVRT